MSRPYCTYTRTITNKDDVDKIYHDHHYGRRIEDDNELFCRFIMEINQAGLSWRTILKKEKGLRKAYHNFNISKIARYDEKEIARLMNDISVIRNKLKISASIYNAKQIILFQKEFGSFRKWIDVQHEAIGQNKNKWLALFKKHFKFVGGEIIGEFLMSIGILSGSHDPLCITQKNIGKLRLY